MSIRWLKQIFSQSEAKHLMANTALDAEEEKRQRVAMLSGDELKAFEWFKMGYTVRWVAETMLLDRRSAKRLFSSVFHKLGAANAAEICKFYRTTPLQPKDADTEEE